MKKQSFINEISLFQLKSIYYGKNFEFELKK